MCLASILPVNEAVKLIIIAVVEKSEDEEKRGAKTSTPFWARRVEVEQWFFYRCI